METLDLENKRLEEELQVQMQKLEGLQSHNNQVKNDLELNTTAIQKSIAKYEQDYGAHVEVLSSISENLMTLLRNVSICYVRVVWFMSVLFESCVDCDG